MFFAPLSTISLRGKKALRDHVAVTVSAGCSEAGGAMGDRGGCDWRGYRGLWGLREVELLGKPCEVLGGAASGRARAADGAADIVGATAEVAGDVGVTPGAGGCVEGRGQRYRGSWERG